METKLPFLGLAQSYNTGRYDYPTEVIDRIIASIASSNPVILDLGCGTGLSTRQLGAAGVMVIGRDPDPTMLEQAIKVGGSNVAYSLGASEQLDFGGTCFDAVTAFGSFHWFSNKHAIDEMRRILKPQGVIAIVNKDDVADGPFATTRAALTEYLETPYHSTKSNYHPAKQLAAHGFSTSEHTIAVHEAYNEARFVQAIKSISIWNHIPASKHLKAEQAVRECFAKWASANELDRKITVRVVIAQKLQF